MPARVGREKPPPRATEASRVPEGDAWLHELAIDGLRLVATAARGAVRLVDARGDDRTAAFPRIAREVASLAGGGRLVLDGVAAVVAPDGTTDRDALDGALARGDDRGVVYFAFDLAEDDGGPRAELGLERRKALLRERLGGVPARSPLRFAAHVIGDGEAFFRAACARGVRGIVSKRRTSRRAPGESDAWRRIDCVATDAPKLAARPLRGSAPGAVQIAYGASGPRDHVSTTEVAGVRITHPTRVVFPEAGVTKIALARFYEAIGDDVVPHLRGRPLTLVRCPHGAGAPCAYMRHAKSWGPSALRRVLVEEKTKVGEYLVADDVAGVVALAQMNVLEIHASNALAASFDTPDRVVFDLDPDPALPFTRVIAAAHALRERLDALGFGAFVKTTGGKGLHVVTPLAPRAGWDDAFAFSHAVAEAMVRDAPRAYTTAMPKERRKGRVLIDVLRNKRGNTAVAAYSTRAQPHAPVSTPLGWHELDAALRPSTLTVLTLPGHLEARGADPWSDYEAARRPVMRRDLRAVAS